MIEYTTEDQLVSDFVTYWQENRPDGVPMGIPFVHFRRTDTLPIPAVIIGHEGFEREKFKGMTGTGRVAFRVALRSDVDVMKAEDHRSITAALDRAIEAMSTKPGPLAWTYLHAMLREAPQTSIDQERRQITVLRYQVVCTRCEEA